MMAMVRSQEPVITVKIPINWEMMTARAQQRLRQMVGRDTRVIRAFFGIIEENEEQLLRGRNRDRIDENKLHAMTMTAERVTGDEKQRLVVEHDLKARFPRISPSELTECRRVAAANYESYLALRRSRGRHSRPSQVNQDRRIPRRIFIPYRARLVKHESTVATWWLELCDSLDSVPEGRRLHDRLTVPLKTAPFHLQQLERGDEKSVQVFTDRRGKWWAAVAVRLPETVAEKSDLPPAVLGIDLGINRAVCTTLLTPSKVSETRYFVQEDKVRLMRRYDQQVADLQHETDTRRDRGLRYDNVVRKLKGLRSKREDVSKEYDRLMVSRLLSYIEELGERYVVHVAIGRLKGIRNTARKGNYQGRWFRGLMHRWCFGRVTRTLKHGLEQMGWRTEGTHSRFHVVPENWTSITCWKCGHRGVRPRQSLFVCHTCGFRTNADRNGSLNIARRLITLIPSLRDENGLGRWATPERRLGPAPKAARGTRSPKQKSALPRTGRASGPRESAVIHSVQTDLLGFGDEAALSDDDCAVEKAVESLTAPRQDADGTGQEKEARTAGGTVSQ
jgi:transposase